MLLVEMYVKGTKDRINITREVIIENLDRIRATIGSAYGVETHTVIIMPKFVSGTDVQAMSAGLPDIFFKIENFGESVKLPFANQLRDTLLGNCASISTVSFKIGIVGRSDMYGNSTFRPN